MTAFLLWVLAGACAGGGTGTEPSGERALAANPATIGLSPGESGSVRFVLTRGGVAVAGESVAFAIVDAVAAQGATLADTTAVTDALGTAAVTVRAGLETVFTVSASVGTAQAEAVIIVAAGPVGSVVAVPFFVSSSGDGTLATGGIEVLLIDGETCQDILLGAPLVTQRPAVTLPAVGGEARFDFVSTDQTSAVAGRALDAQGGIVAAGCVELSGSSLVGGGVVDVALPLDDAVPDPVGTYAVTSSFTFSPPLAAAPALAAPWRDLADCPLDPAQLWLDCTIDALSPATADDPLDCVPAGSEGTLGDALTARRGVPIAAGAGGLSGCRGARDVGGAASLDAIVLGLFGSPLPAAVTALPAIADEAAHLLDRMTLKSTLEVQAAGSPSGYVVTHTLVGAAFGPPPTSVEVALDQFALPVLTAYATASTRDGPLVLDRHGFTLRLGTTARAAFSSLALASRGLPGNTADFIAALAALARSPDGGAEGCGAMDQALCPQVGRSPGCLAAACTAGLGALAARLDAGFDVADGTGLDFYLAGFAPLLDLRGSGFADHLGTTTTDPSQIATWSATLSTGLGRAQVSGSFEGARSK